jgi:hypothetical protein
MKNRIARDEIKKKAFQPVQLKLDSDGVGLIEPKTPRFRLFLATIRHLLIEKK